MTIAVNRNPFPRVCLCRDIQERYRTLTMYAIVVPAEEAGLAGGIEQQWRDLFAEARAVDRSLGTVKRKFTLVSGMCTGTSSYWRDVSLSLPQLCILVVVNLGTKMTVSTDLALQITQDQVKTFSSEAAKFNEKFKSEGPASVGTDLDKGDCVCWP